MSTKRITVTIDDNIYNLLKSKPNISRFVQQAITEMIAEQKVDKIADRVKREVIKDDDFQYQVKTTVENYLEERRNDY